MAWFWSRVPAAWRLWIEALLVAMMSGVVGEVVVPYVEAWVNGEPFVWHALQGKVWAAAMAIGLAWVKQHRPPWNGQERRQE